MTTEEIVENLRGRAGALKQARGRWPIFYVERDADVDRAAADRLERLEQALRPFAEAARTIDERGGADDGTCPGDYPIEVAMDASEQPTVADLRAARAMVAG